MRVEVIFCPACNHKLRVPENLMGAPVQCPQCQAEFIAPPPPTSESPEPAAHREVPAIEPLPPVPAGEYSLAPPPPPGPMVKRIAPGVALIVVALLQILMYGMDLVTVLRDPNAARKAFEQSQQAVANLGLPVQEPPFDPAKFSIVVYAALLAASLVQGLGGFALVKGRFMWVAILASCVSMFNCLSIPCCVAAMPIGLWSAIVLMQADVRASFR